MEAMKRTITFFIATAAVAMALFSCAKELQGNTTEDTQTSSLRTLTVSFGGATRTTLSGDNKQPVWEGGELISLNGTKNIEVPESAKGQKSFTFTTDIQGPITAVYPASAWDSDAASKIKVGSTQDGTFANANICTASASAQSTELVFFNQTAIIEVEVPTDTKNLTLTSLNPIGTSGQRTETAVAIASESTNNTTITVEGKDNSNIPNPCYVSILLPSEGAVLLQDLNIDVEYSEGKKAQGGFSPNYINGILKNGGKSVTSFNYSVEVNTIYTLSESSLHEYVTVGGKKWATQNVAVTASGKREFGSTGLVVGDYFQWASHAGYCGDASAADGGFLIYSAFTNKKCGDTADAFTFKSGVGQFYTQSDKYGVGWSPYCDNTTGEYDNTYSAGTKIRLDLKDDAAFYFWGGAWYMPEKNDFYYLLATTITTKNNFDAASGVLTINDTSLRFPAAGSGSGNFLAGAGDYGGYLSSSLRTELPSLIYGLKFNKDFTSDNVLESYISRHDGLPVRPISGLNKK